MIRVAIRTDEPIVARGLATLLTAEEGFEVVPISCPPSELPAVLAMHNPNILLLDCQVAVAGNLIAAARRALPKCSSVLWVRTISVEFAYQVMQLGVRGILQKTKPPETLLAGLRKIAGGQVWIDEDLATELPDVQTVALTNRESQLLALVARGMKNREMAEVLSITEGTVKVYLSRLFQKAGVRDRYQLALYGIRNVGVPDRGYPSAMVENWPKSLVVGRSAN
jgi:two-component system, NarL family, nitrate/nitrite response regulator NarL